MSSSGSLIPDATGVQLTTIYGYIPNIHFNLAFAIIFGVLFFYHLAVGTYTKQWWFMGSYLFACALECLGYAGRAWAHHEPTGKNPFLIQIICLTIAPVFTMAGVYYQLAKLASVYGHHYSRIKPLWYSYIFIGCDFVSLVVQGLGGGMAGAAVTSGNDTKPGTNVMVAGLAVQVFSMVLFMALSLDFIWKIHNAHVKPRYSHLENHIFVWFPWALFVTVCFVFVRCIYRLIELAQGWTGFLITHEVYFIVLDAVMMLLATLLLGIYHPGFALDGKRTSVPTGKHANDDDDIEEDHHSSGHSDDHQSIKLEIKC